MMQPTLWLSQLQFFSSLGFVLLFLALELGLAWLLVYFRLRSLGSNGPAWLAAYRFWVRIFALAFILAFSSTVPVLVQIGSLWPALTDRAGNVVGPLVAAGLLTAFIFKSCFLGAMLYGQRRLSARLHTFVVLMVAVGITLSSLWLLSLLAWTHTPTGASFVEGQYMVGNWAQVIFNPALPWYAGFLILSSVLAACFLVSGVVAWQALHHPAEPHQRLAFGVALRTSAVASVLLGALVAGSIPMFLAYQPARAAATAAYWRSTEVPDIVLFGWPDQVSGHTRAALSIPGAGASFVANDPKGGLRALDQFSGMMPPVALVFWAFRVAFGVGACMALLSWLCLWRYRRMSDPAQLGGRWLRTLVAFTFAGWVVLVAGFIYVVAGALPFAINGTVTVTELIGTAPFGAIFPVSIAYWVVYALILLGFLHMLWHTARHGVVPVGRTRGRA
jgi:cytochrome d ubiquinol oxidase subunit I